MKHIKKIILVLLCALIAVTFWPRQTPRERLAAAERELAAGQEQLALQLRAYYLGQADERETAQLIEQVENQRLLVEELRAKSAAL